MRDSILTLLIAAVLPFALVHPYVGVLMWVWVGVMNPHRLTWGFAHDLPFAMAIAITTLVGVLFTKDQRRFPVNAVTMTLFFWVLWMNLSSLLALHPELIFPLWSKVMKVQIMIFVALYVLHKKEHFIWLVWVLVVSVGFYGVKGGVFTLATGGQYLVWGPEASFIADNNAISLALVMTIPLIRFLQVTELTRKWAKHACTGAMILCGFSVLGSHSRGALLAIIGMILVLWWRSSKKMLMAFAMLMLVPVAIGFMPANWTERMQTIKTYQEDASAMGRINAWMMTWNLAKDHPITGGGFEIYEADIFQKYAPNPTDIHSAHSIYFQMMGEHGFVGLALFLAIWFSAWRSANWVRKRSKQHEDYKWAGELSAAIQVSLAGYFVGGLFVNMGYFDMPYYELVLVVLTRVWLQDRIKESSGQISAEANGRKGMGFVRSFGSVPGSGN